MSDLLQLMAMCNRKGVPVLEQPQLVYVLTEIFPGSGLKDARLPLNFALVLDRSGSMAGEKLRTLKDAVKKLIDQLQAKDLISIVTFETRTQVLVTAQPAVDKVSLKQQVDRILDGGGTNMANGLLEGLKLVSANVGSERASRIILLTDGEATDNENDSRRIADMAGARNIPIIVLGLGKDWNEDFLFDLADRSLSAPGTRSGLADYIPSPAEAVRIFQEVYRSMEVVAQDVTLTLRMVQGLEARRVWQVTPLIKDLGQSVIQGRTVIVPMGQLEKTGAAYLFEILLPPRSAGLVRVAQAEVAYRANTGGENQVVQDLTVNYSHNADDYSAMLGRVMNVVEKVQAFKFQTQALDEAETGNLGAATQKLRQAITILLAQGDTDLADQMQKEVVQLEQSGQISNEGKKTIKLTSRKTVRLEE